LFLRRSLWRVLRQREIQVFLSEAFRLCVPVLAGVEGVRQRVGGVAPACAGEHEQGREHEQRRRVRRHLVEPLEGKMHRSHELV